MIPLSIVNGRGFLMLSLYVAVLNSVQNIGGVGEDATIGKVAKDCGLTYHRAKRVLDDLQDFGMVYKHLKAHRPNVMKSTYDVSIVGSSWVHLMNINRMNGV